MGFLSKAGSKNNENLWSMSKQFLKFGAVGLSNTALYLMVYYLFLLIDRELYMFGNTAGFAAGILNSYYWNNKYVFQKTEPGHVRPFLKSVLAYGATFLLSSGLLIMTVKILGVPEAAAPFINLLVTVPLNFLLGKFWVFK